MQSKRSRLLLPELIRLEALIETFPTRVKATELARFQSGTDAYPSYLIELAEFDPAKPSLLLTGGGHGLERIGSAVLIAFLESVLTTAGVGSWFAASVKSAESFSFTYGKPGRYGQSQQK